MAAMELRTAIASDISILTGDSHCVDLSDFPAESEDSFVAYSLSGMQLCQKVLRDCIVTKSSQMHENMHIVCSTKVMRCIPFQVDSALGLHRLADIFLRPKYINQVMHRVMSSVKHFPVEFRKAYAVEQSLESESMFGDRFYVFEVLLFYSFIYNERDKMSPLFLTRMLQRMKELIFPVSSIGDLNTMEENFVINTAHTFGFPNKLTLADFGRSILESVRRPFRKVDVERGKSCIVRSIEDRDIWSDRILSDFFWLYLEGRFLFEDEDDAVKAFFVLCNFFHTLWNAPGQVGRTISWADHVVKTLRKCELLIQISTCELRIPEVSVPKREPQKSPPPPTMAFIATDDPYYRYSEGGKSPSPPQSARSDKKLPPLSSRSLPRSPPFSVGSSPVPSARAMADKRNGPTSLLIHTEDPQHKHSEETKSPTHDAQSARISPSFKPEHEEKMRTRTPETKLYSPRAYKATDDPIYRHAEKMRTHSPEAKVGTSGSNNFYEREAEKNRPPSPEPKSKDDPAYHHAERVGGPHSAAGDMYLDVPSYRPTDKTRTVNPEPAAGKPGTIGKIGNRVSFPSYNQQQPEVAVERAAGATEYIISREAEPDYTQWFSKPRVLPLVDDHQMSSSPRRNIFSGSLIAFSDKFSGPNSYDISKTEPVPGGPIMTESMRPYSVPKSSPSSPKSPKLASLVSEYFAPPMSPSKQVQLFDSTLRLPPPASPPRKAPGQLFDSTLRLTTPSRSAAAQSITGASSGASSARFVPAVLVESDSTSSRSYSVPVRVLSPEHILPVSPRSPGLDKTRDLVYQSLNKSGMSPVRSQQLTQQVMGGQSGWESPKASLSDSVAKLEGILARAEHTIKDGNKLREIKSVVSEIRDLARSGTN